MPPYDKEYDGSSRNSHRHDPKGKQREQTVCEELSEGTTYQAYTYPIDDTETYHPPSHQGYSGHPKEYTSYLAPPYSVGLGSSSHCCSGHSTQIPFISPASASMGQSYVGCSSHYQPQPQESSQSSDDAHSLPSAIARSERLDSTGGGIPESLTAIFYARDMIEIDKTNKLMRRMGEEEADAAWANRNNACEKHKKDKKQCDPDKCPNNKRRVRDLKKEAPTSQEQQRFREALCAVFPDRTDRQERRQTIEAFNRSTRRERATMTDEIEARLAYGYRVDDSRSRAHKHIAEKQKLAESRKILYESCRVGYGDEFEAVSKFDYDDFGQVLKYNEITQDPSGAAHFANSQLSSVSPKGFGQAVNPSTLPSVESDPAQSCPEEIDQTPSDPNRHHGAPPAEPEQDPEPNPDLLLRRDATEAEEQKWRESGLDSQEVPRTAWGGLGKAGLHRYCEGGYSTQFDYVPANSFLAFFEPTFVSSVDENN
ncbi:hypothetical protein L207DRAFT_282844 [Hyaloscypha variabilis F]|uniref:Uncharacterized protein n=1 Tax=Hyaloscypha variabilis (strain UAMH 11265 / GT02V1 / F) TaxID=1149755 RepID=A0A2J6S140_HYAVF|nr:hypothetical protein L207DRAFT_282844 [Hyaloscypha variabilis F]